MKVLIIGESCKDIFNYGNCKRMCPEAPVPVFNPSEVIETGGMAMNTYNNVSSLLSTVDIITNDNWESITKTRFVDKRTNHMFMRLDKNDNMYGRIDLTTVDLDEYTAIIVSDYDKGFLTIEDLDYIGSNHKLTFLDTKKCLGPWSKRFSFIKINNIEYEKSINFIDDEMKNNLIITQGPKGCLYRGKNYSVPLVEIKDTSGAGDTFISALCVKFCLTRDIDKSIRFANKCSTKVVQKSGVAII